MDTPDICSESLVARGLSRVKYTSGELRGQASVGIGVFGRSLLAYLWDAIPLPLLYSMKDQILVLNLDKQKWAKKVRIYSSGSLQFLRDRCP